MMWEIPISIFIVCVTLLLLEGLKEINNDKERVFLAAKAKIKADLWDSLSHKLNQDLSSLEEYKKRVDTLTIRAGFK